MKTNKFSVLIGVALGLTLSTSCSKSEDNNDSPAGQSINTYSGSASYGDLVTFSINKGEETYELYNESTGKSETGSFTTMTGELEGVYQVQADGETFFGIELDDKVVVANFPSGNPNNELSFGVSSELDNTSSINNIAGDYMYVKLGDYLNNSPMEWGQFSLTSSGQLFMVDMPGGDIESDFVPYPISENSIGFSEGTWAVNGANKERIDVTIDGDAHSGYAYASGNTAVFLIDLGFGKGTAIAYKITEAGDVAGDYKYVDFWTEGKNEAGNYTLNANGTGSFSYTDGTSIEGPLSFPSTFYQANPVMPNVFGLDDYDGEGSYIYMVVTGEVIMHFIFDSNDNFMSYGAGAQI